MTATVVFARVQPNAVDSPEFAQVTVHVEARIISAMRARHLANGWLLWNIGERIAVGAPELILDQKLVWRFPLRWTSSKQGVLADLAAELRLDALSGEVFETEAKIEEIHQRVQYVARTLQVTGTLSADQIKCLGKNRGFSERRGSLNDHQRSASF